MAEWLVYKMPEREIILRIHRDTRIQADGSLYNLVIVFANDQLDFITIDICPSKQCAEDLLEMFNKISSSNNACGIGWLDSKNMLWLKHQSFLIDDELATELRRMFN